MRLAFTLLLFVGGVCPCFAYEPEGEDDIKALIRSNNAVEAAKMLQHAQDCQAMGTLDGRKAAEFLCKEIFRRYPETPQVDEAKKLFLSLGSPDGSPTEQQENKLKELLETLQSRAERLLQQKAEEAARLLTHAKKSAEEKTRDSMRYAVSLCREILYRYPGTPAAKEAKSMLDTWGVKLYQAPGKQRYPIPDGRLRRPFSENDPFWRPKHPEYFITA